MAIDFNKIIKRAESDFNLNQECVNFAATYGVLKFMIKRKQWEGTFTQLRKRVVKTLSTRQRRVLLSTKDRPVNKMGVNTEFLEEFGIIFTIKKSKRLKITKSYKFDKAMAEYELHKMLDTPAPKSESKSQPKSDPKPKAKSVPVVEPVEAKPELESEKEEIVMTKEAKTQEPVKATKETSKDLVLFALKELNATKVSDIAELADVKSTTVQSAVSLLRNDGYIIETRQVVRKGKNKKEAEYHYKGHINDKKEAPVVEPPLEPKTEAKDDVNDATMLSRVRYLIMALRSCDLDDIMDNLNIDKMTATRLVHTVVERHPEDFAMEVQINIHCRD